MLDPALWQLVYQCILEAERPREGYYTPIPSHTVPFPFQSSLIGVLATSVNAPLKWKHAGWISQKISSGIAYPFDSVSPSQRVILRQVNLIRLPQFLSSEYEIIFDTPTWFVDISLTLWQYKETSVEDDEIKRMLRRIEQKVDDISDFGGN